MLKKGRTILAGLLCAVAALYGCGGKPSEPRSAVSVADDSHLAPVAIQSLERDARLAVLGSVGRRLILLDRNTGHECRTIRLPAVSTSLAVYGTIAYVTTAEPAGRVFAIDLDTGAIRRELSVGHTPMSPVLSLDGRLLCVANRFDDTVALIDLADGSVRTVPVVREPVALALSRDGKRLFVANHLPCVKPFADEENPYIAAEVSVIDTARGRLIENIELPNGSQGVHGIARSPDGKQVIVTHVLSHYVRPTMRIEKGAMNRNALSLLDADTLEWIETVVLDDPNLGAANPWAVAFSSDGKKLLVTHAGTHELSVIDYPALLGRIAARTGTVSPLAGQDLSVPAGIRQRVLLGVNGPRALLERDGVVYVPGFFSDNLAVVDLNAPDPSVRMVALGGPAEPSQARLGEQYFNDATLCFQQWQSCATCHPDGRSDALYWDLLNDGLGNTKNTKSLLMSALTPPVMWRGVRADADTAIRAGIEHIEFAEIRPGQAEAIGQYLLHVKAVPGPRLNAAVLETPKTEAASCGKCHSPGVPRGTLTASGRRGKMLFEGKAGCATCHPHPAFTSMQKVDPGLGSGVLYDVPSLVEVWRTAPYLHNGDALTLRETITNFNFMQKRGRTKDLSEQELDDLLEYLQSL
jgi:DNA-binding beta-propeller fold protein YncE